MPYPESRLIQALGIVRDDDLRRYTLEAEKLARTQYRDRFHFRKSKAIHASSINCWQHDDTSDDDYDPERFGRRRKSHRDNSFENEVGKVKNEKKRKNRTVGLSGGKHQDDTRQSAKKPRVASRGVLSVKPDISHTAFFTIKLHSSRARAFLAKKLEENQDTHIDIYNFNEQRLIMADPSPWRQAGGGLRRIGRSPTEQECAWTYQQCRGDPQEQVEEGLKPNYPRTLRSGKIRHQLVPKKRKQDESSDETEHGEEEHGADHIKPTKTRKFALETDRSAEEKNAIPRDRGENKKSEPGKQVKPYHVGKCPDDAISIDSSSSTESRTLSPASSPTFSSGRKSSTNTAVSSLSPSSSFPSRTWCTATPEARVLMSQAPFTSSCIKTLTTCFAHPINFKATDRFQCTFHQDYRHAILGHGPTVGQYLIYANAPSQLIELDNGHRANGVTPDAMCIQCGLSYLQIIRCPRHRFRLLPPTIRSTEALRDGGHAYVMDLYTELKRGHPNRTLKAMTPICSLCPAPASWSCCTPQVKDRLLRPCQRPGESVEAARSRLSGTSRSQDASNTNINTYDDNNNSNNKPTHTSTSSTLETPAEHQIATTGTFSTTSLGTTPTTTTTTVRLPTSSIEIRPPLLGCTLRLCTACRNLVGDRCGGLLEPNRRTILRELRSRPLGTRADVEFLFKDGLVWKAYYLS